MVDTGVTTGPAQCRQSVTSYLLVRYPHPSAVWPVFLCAVLNWTTGSDDQKRHRKRRALA
jgi:hypothetical protein